MQPFAGFNFSSCIPLSSPALPSDVYCVSVAGRCDPLSLDPTFPRGIFPAPSRGPVREERRGPVNGVLQVWHIYRQSAAQWATARPAWPAPAVPGSRENFYYIPFLTRWQAEIAEPEPVWCAHGRKYAIPLAGLPGQIRIFI